MSSKPRVAHSLIFNEMNYMDELAIGMDTFRLLQENYKLPLPIFAYDGSNVIVTFPREVAVIKDVINRKAIAELSEAELAGYDFVRSNNEVSKKEYAVYFNLSDRVAQNQLRKMRDLNLVGDNGESPKSNKYKYVFMG